MIGFKHLYRALDRRDEAKENSQSDNQSNREPKVIPLHGVSPIIPPLSQGFGLRLIESLFQNDKPIVPKEEVVDLSFYCFQATLAGYLAIDTTLKVYRLLLCP